MKKKKNVTLSEQYQIEKSQKEVHDHSLAFLVTDTTIKREGVKLFLNVEISPLREMSQRVPQNFH